MQYTYSRLLKYVLVKNDQKDNIGDLYHIILILKGVIYAQIKSNDDSGYATGNY